MKTKVTALVGAQTGSEGKGVVAHWMGDEYDVAVRTGAPNAGHSIVHKGKLYKMQTIPCGWTEKNMQLVIGAGALIYLPLLFKELEMVAAVDPSIYDRLLIDKNAGILEQRHHDEEGGVKGEMHARIGSTGEGVGPARRDRIMRDPAKFRLAGDCEELRGKNLNIVDTVSFLNASIKKRAAVLLEGTQGSGLSLIHGPWPYTTSSDTNAAQLAADAGIPPQHVSDVVLVARTYPIRVAGNSGPMGKEVTWDEMSKRVGREVVEFTTVTKKIRRIGEWDETLFAKAVKLNAPTWVALTFMDYLSPEDHNVQSFSKLHKPALKFINYVERSFKVKVKLVGTGFDETKGWSCAERK